MRKLPIMRRPERAPGCDQPARDGQMPELIDAPAPIIWSTNPDDGETARQQFADTIQQFADTIETGCNDCLA
jgi:hypothetical protein